MDNIKLLFKIRLLSYLLFISFLFACNSSIELKKTKKEPLIIEDTTDLIRAYPDEAQFALDEIEPMYINYSENSVEFKVFSNVQDLILTTIDIYRNNQKIQRLKHNNTCASLKFTDWNFDGYKDLTSLTNLGATGNSFYSIWLFNPKKQQFEKNKELDNIASFIDTVKHLIISHYRSGADLENWNYYRFVNSHLIFDHGKSIETVMKSDKRVQRTTLKKIVNNKLLTYVSYK